MIYFISMYKNIYWFFLFISVNELWLIHFVDIVHSFDSGRWLALIPNKS